MDLERFQTVTLGTGAFLCHACTRPVLLPTPDTELSQCTVRCTACGFRVHPRCCVRCCPREHDVPGVRNRDVGDPVEFSYCTKCAEGILLSVMPRTRLHVSPTMACHHDVTCHACLNSLWNGERVRPCQLCGGYVHRACSRYTQPENINQPHIYRVYCHRCFDWNPRAYGAWAPFEGTGRRTRQRQQNWREEEFQAGQ